MSAASQALAVAAGGHVRVMHWSDSVISCAEIAATHLGVRAAQRRNGEARFFSGLRTSQVDLSDIVTYYLGAGGAFLVAVDDTGRLSGFCGLRRISPTVGVLKRFAVVDACRRRGVGAVLCAAMCDVAVGMGVARVELGTGFYEKAFDMYRTVVFVPTGCDPSNNDHQMAYDRSVEHVPHVCDSCDRTMMQPRAGILDDD